MVKHIILWQLKEMCEEEKERRIAQVKAGLEGLRGKIPGMTEIRVITEKLSTSNVDMMLDSTFETQDALDGYSVHPEHVFVAETYIRPYIATRLCMGYEVEAQEILL